MGPGPQERSGGQEKLKRQGRMTTVGCPRNAGSASPTGDSRGFRRPLVPALCQLRPHPPNTPHFSDIRAGALRCQLKVSPRPRAPRNCRPRPPPLPGMAENGAQHGEILSSADLHSLLHVLQAVRVGDFSVRLPSERTGLAGKIADTFNDIVAANQRMAQQIERVGQVVGRDGKTRPARQVRPLQRRLGRDGEHRQFADRRPALADDRGDPGDRRRCQGRPPADRAASMSTAGR